MSGPETAAAGMQAVGDLGRQVMSKVGDLGRGSVDKAAPQRDAEPANTDRWLSPTRVDGAVQSVRDDFDAAVAESPHLPTDEQIHRDSLIIQIEKVPLEILEMLEKGSGRAIRELTAPERVKANSEIASLLGYAATMAIGGAAATIAAKLIVSVLEGAGAKALELGLREAVKHGLRAAAAVKAPTGHVDLLNAFARQVEDQRTAARIGLVGEFAALHTRVATLPTPALETLASNLYRRIAQEFGEIQEHVANQTVIAWTNFLARIHHGAMGEWDLWADNGSKGAVELKGAASKPTTLAEAREATAGNVAPRAASQLHNAEADEHVGILEIALDLHGGLLTDGRGMNYGPSYGMRLENVGPGARERIQRLGRVRDAPINKLIRIYEVGDHAVSPVGSVMITADGYVRYYDLGGQTRVHADPRPESLEEALGIEPRAFRVNVAANERVCRDLAERAQAFPLSWIQS